MMPFTRHSEARQREVSLSRNDTHDAAFLGASPMMYHQHYSLSLVVFRLPFESVTRAEPSPHAATHIWHDTSSHTMLPISIAHRRLLHFGTHYYIRGTLPQNVGESFNRRHFQPRSFQPQAKYLALPLERELRAALCIRRCHMA